MALSIAAARARPDSRYPRDWKNRHLHRCRRRMVAMRDGVDAPLAHDLPPQLRPHGRPCTMMIPITRGHCRSASWNSAFSGKLPPALARCYEAAGRRSCTKSIAPTASSAVGRSALAVVSNTLSRPRKHALARHQEKLPREQSRPVYHPVLVARPRVVMINPANLAGRPSGIRRASGDGVGQADLQPQAGGRRRAVAAARSSREARSNASGSGGFRRD